MDNKHTLTDNIASAFIGLLLGAFICVGSWQQAWKELTYGEGVRNVDVLYSEFVEKMVDITLDTVNFMNAYNSAFMFDDVQLFKPNTITRLAKDAREETEKQLLAQLVHAEAGNQDLDGKRLVVDVVLNRVDDPRFPNTIKEVIFQTEPCVQFTVTENGALERAAEELTDSDWGAVDLEYSAETRLDSGVLFFGRGKSECAVDHFKCGDHWFGY